MTTTITINSLLSLNPESIFLGAVGRMLWVQYIATVTVDDSDLYHFKLYDNASEQIFDYDM